MPALQRRGPHPGARGAAHRAELHQPGRTAPASGTCPGSSTATPTRAASPRSRSSARRSASSARGAAGRATWCSPRPATTTRWATPGRSHRCPRPSPRCTSRGSTRPPSAPACGGRSSTSLPTRCPTRGCSEAQQHFGLLRADLTPKPAFTAITTLLAALRLSPGRPAQRGRLGWTLQVDGGERQRRPAPRPRAARRLARPRPVARGVGLGPRPAHPADAGAARGRAAVRPARAGRRRLAPERVGRRPSSGSRRRRQLPLQLGGDLVVVSLGDRRRAGPWGRRCSLAGVRPAAPLRP